MIYDFDKIHDRNGTDSVKYDFRKENGYAEDVLPLWVADMDFTCAEPIRQALIRTSEQSIYGYSDCCGNDYYEAVSGWFENHFGWKPQEKWLIKTPGVVFALAMAVRAFTEEGDAVLVQPPVYYPFFMVIEKNNRKAVENPLVYDGEKYSIDFDDFEQKIINNNVKLFMLCSPHNPVCRVWREDELREISRICMKHGVKIISDEIHCDFTLEGHTHHILTELCPELEDCSVICTAPSKTFNLAGLQTSNIWIASPAMRRAFRREMDAAGCFGVNRFGIAACQAAYSHGEEWLTQLKEYLKGNLSYVREYLKENLPQIKLIEPEGTYFAWLDCSALGMNADELHRFIAEKAKLWLDDGSIFRGGADRFQRIVLACPRAVLEEAMNRLNGAIKSLKGETE